MGQGDGLTNDKDVCYACIIFEYYFAHLKNGYLKICKKKR
jgi:hypothetical protein